MAMLPMRTVRFHGRGGQGAKTASRIVGTAAFIEGFVAQDSPIYGAERRGAPVAAFTRIAKEPIRERGLIARPDLVVIADASLIHDPAARVLDGVDERTAVFVNSPLTAEQFQSQTSLPSRLTTMDLTDIALQQFGKRGAISSLLGAVAGRLVGLRQESIREAIARELADLGLAASVIERNQTVAAQCYEAVPVVAIETSTRQPAPPVQLQVPTYEPPTRGTARISAVANSVLRETGGWRTFRPVLVPDKCNGCWLCFAYCPDGVISMTKDDRPVIDYAHCKGCQICVHECPTEALMAEREKEGAVAWTVK
ncbi:MAG TPA: 2-oxoacid:acceptor oxidoreductase family protein [Nitrospiraceae bacterium]|nr:2-oxoacid:acceptor oxidoreductase family protein [Nitrospiraceae bacterium]